MFIPKKNKLTAQLNALVPSLESQPAVVEAAVVRQVASELQVPASPAINAAVAFEAHLPYVEARLAEIEHTYMMPRPRAEVVDAVQQQFAARYNIAHDPAQAVAVEEAAECGKVVPEVLVRVASLMQDGEPLASVESFIYAPAEVVGSAAIKSSLEHLAAGLDLDVERDGMAHYKAALEGHALLHAEAARVGATIDEIVGKPTPGLEGDGPNIFQKAWAGIKAFFSWFWDQLKRIWTMITRNKEKRAEMDRRCSVTINDRYMMNLIESVSKKIIKEVASKGADKLAAEINTTIDATSEQKESGAGSEDKIVKDLAGVSSAILAIIEHGIVSPDNEPGEIVPLLVGSQSFQKFLMEFADKVNTEIPRVYNLFMAKTTLADGDLESFKEQLAPYDDFYKKYGFDTPPKTVSEIIEKFMAEVSSAAEAEKFASLANYHNFYVRGRGTERMQRMGDPDSLKNIANSLNTLDSAAAKEGGEIRMAMWKALRPHAMAHQAVLMAAHRIDNASVKMLGAYLDLGTALAKLSVTVDGDIDSIPRELLANNVIAAQAISGGGLVPPAEAKKYLDAIKN